MARIIGSTEIETGNRVVMRDGETRYLRCGADIVLTGLFQDVKGTAVCPVCKQTVRVVVRGGKIASTYPAAPLLHYVTMRPTKPGMFGIKCEGTFIFDTKGCLDEWLESYSGPPGKVASLDDFLTEIVSTKKHLGRSS